MFAPRTPLRRNEQQQQQQQQEGALHDAQPSSSSEVQQNANAESIQLGADASEPVKQNGFIASFMSDNPYFSAGFGLMGVGAGLAVLRRGVNFAASSAQRRLLVSLEIPSKDRAHPWFLHWMGAQAQAQQLRERTRGTTKESLREFLGVGKGSSGSGSQAVEHAHTVNAQGSKGKSVTPDPLSLSAGGSVSPVRIYSHDLSVETSYAPHASASNAGSGAAERGDARFSLVPGPGTHWFRYRNIWMRLQRERDGKMVDLHTGAPWETVTLTTLYSYAHLFPMLLAEARQLALAATEGKTVIYTSWGPEWRPFGQPRRTRELGSVVLGPGKKEAIVEDVKRFLKRGGWYAERGIPYRRGYLLHGAPGSGKSSFITALAGALDFNICLLNLSERGLTDDKLNHLLSNAPERSILLLEDVDAAFLGRQMTGEDGYQSSVTFSGLLNALDGVASGESRIIFMTTNHVERLDPALIRPGRVDMIAELGDAEPAQVRELVLRFYRGTMRDQRASRRAAANATATRVDSPTQAEAHDTAEKEAEEQLDALALELASEVETEATRRRASVGLDPSGRFPLSSSPSPGDPSSAETQAQTQAQTEPKSTSLAAAALRPRAAASGGVSMAELQGLFIRFPDDPRAAIEAFRIESEMRRSASASANV